MMFMQGYVTYKPAPPLSPPTSLMTQCEVVNVDDVMSLSDTPPPVSWEGPLEKLDINDKLLIFLFIGHCLIYQRAAANHLLILIIILLIY